MFNRRSCLVIQKTMAMTNINFDRYFFIIAITQKLLAGFYLNLYPVVVMKLFISHYFLFFPSSPPSVIELVPPGTCAAWTRSPLINWNFLKVWNFFLVFCHNGFHNLSHLVMENWQHSPLFAFRVYWDSLPQTSSHSYQEQTHRFF